MMALIRRTTHVVEPDEPVSRWIFGPEAYPEFFRPLFRSLYGEDYPRVHEYMDGDTLVINAELPGLDPDDDIELTVSDHTLHIHAQRRVEQEPHRKGLNPFEFRYGAVPMFLSKSLPLPTGVDETDVEATYKAGILEIRVPVDEAKASVTKIPVRTG